MFFSFMCYSYISNDAPHISANLFHGSIGRVNLHRLIAPQWHGTDKIAGFNKQCRVLKIEGMKFRMSHHGTCVYKLWFYLSRFSRQNPSLPELNIEFIGQLYIK